jgi:hypothetical protein
MDRGVYISWGNESRFIATMDELVLGNARDRSDIGRDLVSALRDVAVELLEGEEDDVGKVQITIVQ